jgi:hypothetical protein
LRRANQQEIFIWEENLDTPSKINILLEAWLRFLDLEDLSQQIPKSQDVRLRGVSIAGNRLLLSSLLFTELRKSLQASQHGQTDQIWALSFPQIYQVDESDPKDKQKFYPIFSINISPLLNEHFQPQGWELDELEFLGAGKSLQKLLNLVDEQFAELITSNGLCHFLEATFNSQFETFEDWMQQVQLPNCMEAEDYAKRTQQYGKQPYALCRLPFLFKFKAGVISYNLRQDFKQIKTDLGRQWQHSRHPAYEFLFGQPNPPNHELVYFGAFPTYPPVDTQLIALKHAQTEPITAVQGPPGSGKTTLSLHVIAQQIVKRALSLIETGNNLNNLTVISSTVYQAIDNVIERIDEDFQTDFLYLKGGSRPVIEAEGGAVEKIQSAISYLQETLFNEEQYCLLAQDIQQIKQNLENYETNFLDLRQLRQMKVDQKDRLQEQVQDLEQQLTENNASIKKYRRRFRELSAYEQFPEAIYQRLGQLLADTQQSLPNPSSSWIIQVWNWFRRKTEKQILRRVKQESYLLNEQIRHSQFAIDLPQDRGSLADTLRLIQTRLNDHRDWQFTQTELADLSRSRTQMETDCSEARKVLQDLELQLSEPIGDFYATFHVHHHEQQQKLFRLAYEYLLQEAVKQKASVVPALNIYLDVLSRDGMTRTQAKDRITKTPAVLQEQMQWISLMFPVITCGLYSIKNMLPWLDECVDRSIIDEAGMIPLHQAFPLLVRSRQAIIVGDPLQIEPVITQSLNALENYQHQAFFERGLNKTDYYRYSPAATESATTYHRAAAATGEIKSFDYGIRLLEHYRCQPSIINFCDRIAGYGLITKTELKESLIGHNLLAYHVEGKIADEVNQEEIVAVHEIVEHLINQGYSPSDFGIISAFKLQAEGLKTVRVKGKSLIEKFPVLSESIGTVHKFQGSQRRVIILSTRVCRRQDSVTWINRRPNLINVAVSRAEELFILVGNLHRLRNGRFTRQLVEHIEDQGMVLEYKPESAIPDEVGTASEHSLIFDCEHLRVLDQALQEVVQELIIVSPIIRGAPAKEFTQRILPVLRRGVQVKIVHANYDENDPAAEVEKSREARALEKLCQKEFNVTLHPVVNRGTNERYLIWDRKFAVIGTWNWLSHPYTLTCKRGETNPAVQVRKETSVILTDQRNVQSIVNRVERMRE